MPGAEALQGSRAQGVPRKASAKIRKNPEPASADAGIFYEKVRYIAVIYGRLGFRGLGRPGSFGSFGFLGGFGRFGRIGGIGAMLRGIPLFGSGMAVEFALGARLFGILLVVGILLAVGSRLAVRSVGSGRDAALVDGNLDFKHRLYGRECTAVAGLTSVRASPESPARPVRPMR